MANKRSNLIAIAVLACTSVCIADSIQLRRRAVVASDAVQLKDVATLDGHAAEALADTVIVRGTGATSITQEALRQTLSKAGANWAKISLKGFESCEIVRSAPQTTAPTAPALIDAPAAPIVANPTEPVGSESSLTVGQRLTDWLQRIHQRSQDDLRVTFADRDRKHLDQTIGQDQLVFTGSATLGRTTVTCQRMRGEKILATQRFSVEVARRELAVTAVRAIAKGATIGLSDIDVREMFIDRTDLKPVLKLDEAFGRTATSAIAEGAVLTSDNLRAALLVQRNELIRVQALAGGLLIQTTARALEDGGDGQIIKARNERSREVFAVRVTGARQALLVADQPVQEEKGSKAARKAPEVR